MVPDESCHNRVESSKVSVEYLYNIHLESSWNGCSVFGPQYIPRGLPSQWSYISDVIVALVNYYIRCSYSRVTFKADLT